MDDQHGILMDAMNELRLAVVHGCGREQVSELLDRLISKRMDNAEMGVILRGDGTAKYRQVRAVLDVCQQANVTKVDLATEASDKKK